jgi:hypothetical protein
MKNIIVKATLGFVLMSYFISCAPKYGCPANRNNMGAEKILEGGKMPKMKKMKV